MLYNEEDFWLSQKSVPKLFKVAENNITYHLQNIFKAGELIENSVTQKIRVAQKEGTRKFSIFRNLSIALQELISTVVDMATITNHVMDKVLDSVDDAV